jgi:hypothetical protein
MVPDIKLPIQIRLGKGDEMKNFQLNKLDLVRQDRIQSIYDFIQNKVTIRPHETVRIIETLFKQRARNDLICVKHQFYDKRQQLEDLS